MYLIIEKRNGTRKIPTTQLILLLLAAKVRSASQPLISLNAAMFITNTQSDPPRVPVHSYHWINITSLANPFPKISHGKLMVALM